MTSRRSFLGTIAGAGAAILAGPEVLELFERLAHRTVFTGATFGVGLTDMVTTTSLHGLSTFTLSHWNTQIIVSQGVYDDLIAQHRAGYLT